MPLYMCRWINGNISFVWARNKIDAMEALDEIDNAEGCPLIPVNDFMVHFGLTDQGELELKGFGEAAEDEIFEKDYPLLEQAIMGAPDGFERDKPAGKALVKDAVERVRPIPLPKPKTTLGKEIKRQMGVPTSLVDEIVRIEVEEVLKKFRPRGKPH